MPLFLSIFPIVLLIWLMVKKNSVPSYIALPVTAVLIYIIQMFYFNSPTLALNANVAAVPVSGCADPASVIVMER